MKRKFIIFSVLCLVGVGLYYDITTWAPQRFKTRMETIQSTKIPEDLDNVSIGYLSDVNGSLDLLSRASAALNFAQVDALVFGGNLLADVASTTDAEAMIEQLKAVNAPLGKFAVLSTRDYRQDYDLIQSILSQSGFTILNNKNLEFHNRSQVFINLVGIDGNVHPKEKEDLYYPELQQPDAFTMVFVNNPAIRESLHTKPYDVMISGDTLGGQVRLPFVGSLLNKPNYDNRLEEEGHIFLVSMGLGVMEPEIRFLTNPEVIIITLERQPS